MTSRKSLQDLKESDPLETAEYAVAQEIDHGPTLKYWLKAVLKKRLIMIPLVKNRNTLYIKKTHKFGIEVPKSIVQVYVLDKNNGNTLREDAIYKEM